MILADFTLENNYFMALAILIGFVIAAYIVLFLLEKFVLKLTKKTKTELDDLLIAGIKKPLFYLIVLEGLKQASIQIGFGEVMQGIIKNLISTVMIVLVTIGILVIVDILIKEWGRKFSEKTKSSIDDSLLKLFQKVARVVVIVLGFLYLLDLWGAEVGPLMASLGIAGLAVAFALQSTLGNILGGISLLIDKSVEAGCRIQLDTGESGIVEDVGLRSTKIRTWTNDIIVVPNGKLADSKIQHFLGENQKARVDVDFGVAYGSDVDNVQKIVINAITNVKGCMKKPEPAVDFTKMGDSALIFKAKFWVKDVSERYGSMLEANKAVYDVLNKEGISIPFPQMDVHLYNKG